jgi:hypothetical protein
MCGVPGIYISSGASLEHPRFPGFHLMSFDQCGHIWGVFQEARDLYILLFNFG